MADKTAKTSKTSKTTKTATAQTTSASTLDRSALLPSDMFTASSPLQPLSEDQARAELDKIAGQGRRLDIRQANEGLVQKVAKLDQAAAQTAVEETKALTGWEKHQQALVALQAAQIDTQSVGQDLQQSTDRLEFKSAQTKLNKETSDIRLQGLTAARDHNLRMLDTQRQQYELESQNAVDKLSARFNGLKSAQ